ncbi:hypothetical protein VFPFJ_03287 [Purpureocillium lilacinum]|uniref:DUF3824 domain-containing protein n=1 Tax=Purpureocillium lilacinum TaxID=33203 RepID=A0A179HMK7_PURLI|nr:hypothetical protein VFPFJ_03287 [Purpureocillium lilacinum]OAQ91547.1 hypothetical protein VFPFJ_03287 [Purpureocillium lilacinum]PWI67554.1 hypothetical protein PCL_02908 [Purpureocillium lilacinum]
MASYDPYDRDYSRRYVREERRDDRDPRFLDSRGDYGRVYPSRDLVPRAREDSDLSVEEIRRDFPPPSGRDIRRARSAEPQYYEDEYDYRRGYDSRHDRDRDHDRHSDRHARRAGGSMYYEEEERRAKPKSMSKQEKIIAAVAGAALLVGGKELYDRHEAKTDGTNVQRNALSSAALAGFGALAGYQGAEFYSKQQAKKDQKATYILHRGRDGQITEYYSDEEEGSKEKKGHKNFLESAIAATGLGAAVKTLTGGGSDDKRSDTRSRRGSPSGSRAGSRSRSRGPGTNKIQKAAMASLLAGATEAFRVAKEPGGWKGEKTKRILTAAAGAATVDAAQSDSHGKLGLAESVIGGLVGNRLINGSKKDIEEDKLTGRSRSRSRARSQSGGGGGGTGLAALATAGLGALGAKKVLDHSRSRSRGRDYDSRSPSPDRHRQRSRSRSVVDKARNSLAKLGIGGGAVAAADDHRRRDQDDFDDRGSSRRSRRYSDDEYDDDRGHGRSRGYEYESERSHRGSRRDSSRRRGGSRSGYGSESDLGDSDEDEKRQRKMRGKQILTTGLATVATIHAAHGVYQSMEKRRARQKAVKEGRLSPAEAKKLKTKAIMQDAASVGIAALGIKGAIGEMKEAKEMTHECKEFKEEKARRHERREMRRQQGRSLRDGSSRRADSLPAGPRSRYGGNESDEEDDYGPRYYDDNPYNAGRLPAPPMGYRP